MTRPLEVRAVVIAAWEGARPWDARTLAMRVRSRSDCDRRADRRPDLVADTVGRSRPGRAQRLGWTPGIVIGIDVVVGRGRGPVYSDRYQSTQNE